MLEALTALLKFVLYAGVLSGSAGSVRGPALLFLLGVASASPAQEEPIRFRTRVQTVLLNVATAPRAHLRTALDVTPTPITWRRPSLQW